MGQVIKYHGINSSRHILLSRLCANKELWLGTSNEDYYPPLLVFP